LIAAHACTSDGFDDADVKADKRRAGGMDPGRGGRGVAVVDVKRLDSEEDTNEVL
jgi:hypothetical protein